MDLGIAGQGRARHGRLQGHRARDRRRAGGRGRDGGDRARARASASRRPPPRSAPAPTSTTAPTSTPSGRSSTPWSATWARWTSWSPTRADRRPGPIRSASPASSGRPPTASSCSRPMALIERTMPGMRERGFGRVVGVSSSAVREPIEPCLMLSNSHRPGLLAAFKTLAREVAADGVTLNSILPGRIATDRILGSRRLARGGRGGRLARRAGRAAGHRGGDRGRGGVPVLRARELHHRRGAAGRRRAHAQLLALLGSPPSRQRCLRWPVKVITCWMPLGRLV